MPNRFKQIVSCICLLSILLGSRLLHAQESDAEYDSLLNAYLKQDSIWLDEIQRDSLSIFSLLDSLTSFQPKSQLVVRASYSSQLLTNGRTYGIDQYGASSGLSYYHKSGLYADISGQYFSGVSPSYNSTNLILGYGKFIGKSLSLNGSIGKTFFNELEEEGFDNTLEYQFSLGAYYSLDFVTLGLDYSYLFGSTNSDAHRLLPSLSLHPKIKTRGFLSHISFRPYLTLNYGSETLYSQNLSHFKARQVIDQIGLRRFRFLLRNENEQLLDFIFEEDESDHFGLLNTQVSFPLRFSKGAFSSVMTYHHSFPTTLPDEVEPETNNGYWSLSLYYTFGL